MAGHRFRVECIRRGEGANFSIFETSDIFANNLFTAITHLNVHGLFDNCYMTSFSIREIPPDGLEGGGSGRS